MGVGQLKGGLPPARVGAGAAAAHDVAGEHRRCRPRRRDSKSLLGGLSLLTREKCMPVLLLLLLLPLLLDRALATLTAHTALVALAGKCLRVAFASIRRPTLLFLLLLLLFLAAAAAGS